MTIFSGRRRHPSLGPYPLERVPRAPVEVTLPQRPRTEPLRFTDTAHPLSLANSLDAFMLHLDRMRDGPGAEKAAAIPEDLTERANHLKAAAYFLNASMVGVCSIPSTAWLANPITHPELATDPTNPSGLRAKYAGVIPDNQAPEEERNPRTDTHACVLLVEYTREAKPDEPGAAWIAGTNAQRAALRSAEVAVILAQYLRWLGYTGRAHTATTADLDIDTLIVAAGLGVSDQSGDAIRNPFLGVRYGAAVISTTLPMATDQPIDPARASSARDFRWWLGFGGTRPGYQGALYRGRPFHLGLHPMETVKRVDDTTTFIDHPNVPRVPKRHDMFMRAVAGDLGPKAQRELKSGRCVTKSPIANAIIPLMGSLVPLQAGPAAPVKSASAMDPERNAGAVKAALHYLGADVVGISEAPAYTWYSHQLDGTPIEPVHRYAVTILIDQGYNSFDGSSGDDWINAAQSQRGYVRASMFCSIVAAHIRSLGFSARSHSNASGDVLQLPLMMLAGLGELSRIGEVVLNPFIGPRFKSGVITTDMPLAVDRPIDFGMQDFCEKCTKCARECPCSAIPFGEKIRFNGYEMWKPDVEKCARYRITNVAGAMCGRCLKTCPFNLEGVMAERPFLWAAMHLPFTRRWLSRLDDKMGNGQINPVQKWWWDLDTDEQGTAIQAHKVNARPLNFRPGMSRDQQKLAAFPVELAPPPVTDGPVPPDRKAGIEFYRNAGCGSGKCGCAAGSTPSAGKKPA